MPVPSWKGEAGHGAGSVKFDAGDATPMGSWETVRLSSAADQSPFSAWRGLLSTSLLARSIAVHSLPTGGWFAGGPDHAVSSVPGPCDVDLPPPSFPA